MSKKPSFRIVFKGNEKKPAIKGDLLEGKIIIKFKNYQ